eukprot:3958294-Karenia_brevis.AAC.1
MKTPIALLCRDLILQMIPGWYLTTSTWPCSVLLQCAAVRPLPQERSDGSIRNQVRRKGREMVLHTICGGESEQKEAISEGAYR